MNVYCEQNLSNSNVEKKKKKNTVLKIVRIVLLILIVVSAIFAYINIINAKLKPISGFIINLIFSLLFVVPFILGFIFVGKYIANFNMEYDYILIDGQMRIVKVINRSKRRIFTTINFADVESVGRLDCDAYERYAQSKEIKKQFAICDYENEENIAYIYYNKDGAKFLMHIEPNDELVLAIKRSVPRVSVIDKSFTVSAPAKTEEE